MSDNIEIAYKNSRIKFDTRTEEWVGYLNSDKFYEIGTDEFKRNTSLQKLKDFIDRFNKKNFNPIPIYFFYNNNDRRNAEIISFTSIPGECWIRREDGHRELIRTIKSGYSSVTKIYACENIHNEPIGLKIIEAVDELEKIEKTLAQKKGEIINLINSLEPFDIGGMVVAVDEDIVM